MRNFLCRLALAASIAMPFAAPLLAHAQTGAWPSRPVRVVVPVSPGSFTDFAGRMLAAEFTEQTGQQMVVENKPGAGTTLGADFVAKSPADGYTLLITENSFSISPALYAKLPYDTLRDFIPITLVAEAPTLFFARPGFGPRTVKELVALGQSRPGNIIYGSGGNGTSSHLAAEAFFDRAKFSVTHVPFKGVAPALAEVVAERVDIATSSVAGPMAMVRAGKVRPIAVTGKERSPMLPDVPTFAESGYADYDAPIWFGYAAPAGTPPAVIARIHAELTRGVAKPKVRDAFQERGARAYTMPQPEFARRIEAEIRAMRDIVTRAGVKAD